MLLGDEPLSCGKAEAALWVLEQQERLDPLWRRVGPRNLLDAPASVLVRLASGREVSEAELAASHPDEADSDLHPAARTLKSLRASVVVEGSECAGVVALGGGYVCFERDRERVLALQRKPWIEGFSVRGFGPADQIPFDSERHWLDIERADCIWIRHGDFPPVPRSVWSARGNTYAHVDPRPVVREVTSLSERRRPNEILLLRLGRRERLQAPDWAKGSHLIFGGQGRGRWCVPYSKALLDTKHYLLVELEMSADQPQELQIALAVSLSCRAVAVHGP